MTTELIPLGTASAIPANGRHLSALALQRQGTVLLFDCGEGTQFQLLRAGLKRSRIEVIFITHFHGDHFYGLMGLLSTMALLKRRDALTLVGPEGLASILRSLPGLANDWLPFEVRYVEIAEGFEHEIVAETDVYTVEARPLQHRIFTIGYRYHEKPRPGHLDVEKARAMGVTDYRHYRALKAGEAITLDDGRVVQPEEVVGSPTPGVSFAYVTDTEPCEAGVALARAVDVLYHDATFAQDLQHRAVETGHSTAREAADIARRAEAKKLLLGHFSARYKTLDVLVEEARTVFQNTEAAEELKRYVLRDA
jgi:ribonuclease Z